jgi:hypothetical protein
MKSGSFLYMLLFHFLIICENLIIENNWGLCKLTACSDGQRRTGGLVIWKSGSVMVVYRGSNYKGPSRGQPDAREGDAPFVPDVSSADSSSTRSDSGATPSLEKSEPAVRNPNRPVSMTEEEAEYNSLLDGLGPRFVEWWGTGLLPVDADLLPQKVPGYKTPFRLLPTGMRSRLTNAEMTNLRKLAKSLPCHFALGIFTFYEYFSLCLYLYL